MKRVLILSNHHRYTYNFRKETIERLIQENYDVYLALPYGEKVEPLKQMGCHFIDQPVDERGKNPFTDLKLLLNYCRIMKRIKPDAVLSYTTKPNVYGGIATRLLNVPFFPNITGLGSAVENDSILQKILIKLYRTAYKKASCVFFQNEENHEFFQTNNIQLKKSKIIPGSGVNVKDFQVLNYPDSELTEFIFISRIKQQKGIDQYLEAAKYIREKYPNTRFHILGNCEEDYSDELNRLHNEGIIQYHGLQSDIRQYLKNTHCTILPSYHEGMANVLLESAASGRPIITSDVPGCREIVSEGSNGYKIPSRDSQALIEVIQKFIKLSYEEKKQMGLAGRKKVEEEFDRQIVVDSYIEEMEDKLKIKTSN